MSPKLYFNYACALAELKRYSEALTALEESIHLDDDYENLETSQTEEKFNSRAKAYSDDGAELAPFWPGSFNTEARAATSQSGKTFDELIRQVR